MSTLKETKVQVWEYLGPISPGGTVFGVAISPVEDVPRYWVATSCGIFYTEDGGKTWTQSLNGLSTPLLSALTVAPNGALFAGSLEGDLFASFDFGESWEAGLVPQELRGTVTVLAASPNFAKDGTVFAATDGGGLLVSRDSAKNWEDSGFGLGDLSVVALATSPDWSRREIMFAATPEGVFISRNGGRAWRETDLMMEEDVVSVLAVSPGFAQDRTVFAGTETGDLYRSTDGGRTWDLLQSQLGPGSVNGLWLAPDFAESGRMVAGVGQQLYLSNDGGESWQQVSELPGSVLALAGDAQVVLVGLHDAGLWKSTDGGDTWASASDQLSARGFARIVPAGAKLYTFGPQEGLWVSEDRGQTWQSLESVSAHLPLSAASVSEKGPLFIATPEEGILRSTDDGQSWQVVARETSVQALLVLPEEGVGWAGTRDGRLFLTKDGGETWQEAKNRWEGQEVLGIAASPAYARDHTVFMCTLIPETANRPTRVALWKSSDGGENWQQLTTQATPVRWVDIAMPSDVENPAEQAVAATGPYCLRPLRRARSVWISTRVDPGEANVLGLVAFGNLDAGGLLFAATGNGVYRSNDGGRTWEPFGEGLTAPSFIGLAALQEGQEVELYALSLGGQLWRHRFTWPSKD
ncbi:MAG: hypothetical protein J7M05_09010 [Anaerolineae bacterium]|nr:hypothetical protein [Anaerolineae bacterium]